MQARAKRNAAANVLSTAVQRMTKSAIKQMRDTGEIDSDLLEKAFDSAMPTNPKIVSICFVSEEHMLALKLETGKYRMVEMGPEIEGFLCAQVIPVGPKTVVAWEDLEEVWSGDRIKKSTAKFKKRMQDAMRRINDRCCFKLFKWNREGVFW